MSSQHPSLLRQAFAYWNWKCALISATARSLVYLAAMAHTSPHRALPVVLVEVGYVTLTAGVYAGMQQNALRLRSRLFGNLIVVLGVPGLGQTLDWFTHRLTRTVATHRTINSSQSGNLTTRRRTSLLSFEPVGCTAGCLSCTRWFHRHIAI